MSSRVAIPLRGNVRLLACLVGAVLWLPSAARAADPDVAFVVSAPVFRGWLQDPLVAKVVARAPLDDGLADELFAHDRTGDTMLAALNAAVLVQRRSPRDLETWLWRSIRRRHGNDQATPWPVARLLGIEAMALGYVGALDHRGLATPPDDDDAARALPSRLFVHGRSLLPGDALLGPLLANGHLVDLDRARSACSARARVDALRFVIHKGALPAAARQPLVQALDAVAAQCTTAPR